MMNDTLRFDIKNLREDRKEFRGNIYFYYNHSEHSFININLKDLYTKINIWLNSEFLETFTYKNHFSLDSEDGDTWYLLSDTSDPNFKVEVDIDEVILELWKLNARIEVNLEENFEVDIRPKKKTH